MVESEHAIQIQSGNRIPAQTGVWITPRACLHQNDVHWIGNVALSLPSILQL